MASYRDDYITWAEFEAKRRNGIPYEGFVIGLGYAYTKEAVIVPPNQNGWFAIPRNNNFPMDATHHQLVTEQCLDSSDYCKERSRLGEDTSTVVGDIYKSIVCDNGDGTLTVNVGGGYITLLKEHSDIRINVRDTGNNMEVEVSATNTSTGETRSIHCGSVNEFIAQCRVGVSTPTSASGLNVEGFAGMALNIGSESGSWAERILNDRGRYLPPKERFGPNVLDPIVRTPAGNVKVPSKMMRGLRSGGKVMGGIGIGITIIDIYNDATTGKIPSAITRGAVAVVTYGLSAIPIVGWALAIGVSVADSYWGDEFYHWIDEEFSSSYVNSTFIMF